MVNKIDIIDVIDYLNENDDDERVRGFKIKHIIWSSGEYDSNSFIEYYNILDCLDELSQEYSTEFEKYIKYLYNVIRNSKEIEFVNGTVFKLKKGKFHSVEEPAIVSINDYDGSLNLVYFINGEYCDIFEWDKKRAPYLREYKLKQILSNG